MHVFKHGELASHGRKVRNPKQAVAIGLSEAGASREQSPEQNHRRLKRTKQRENATEPTRAELYEEAKRRGIAGRARMDKAALARALGS